MGKYDPVNIFVVAEQFRNGSKWLTMAKHQGYPFTVDMSIVTCSAFALELYLKCLIAIAGKPTPPLHDLKDLFKKLAPAMKTKIQQHWETMYANDVRTFIADIYSGSGIAAPKVDFDFVLTASRKAFEMARYIYETGLPGGKGWLADSILESTRIAILEIHPDWINAYQSSPQVLRQISATSRGR